MKLTMKKSSTCKGTENLDLSVTSNALKSCTMQYMLSENNHKMEVLFSSI